MIYKLEEFVSIYVSVLYKDQRMERERKYDSCFYLTNTDMVLLNRIRDDQIVIAQTRETNGQLFPVDQHKLV